MSLKHWETYYRAGPIATCPTAPDGGYDQEVRSAWVNFFSTLPAQARILDVGTGNGIVALIASETAMTLGREWEIHATDLARIDPIKHVADAADRLAGITFHPGVATERLPFDAESFDAVTGHYAIEYTDTAAALAEIHRVLRHGSDAQFIVHHADSTLVCSARQSLQEADVVFVETKIYRRLHRLVSMDHIVPGATQAAADELRGAIRILKQRLAEMQGIGSGRILSVALDGVQKLLAARREMTSVVVAHEVERAEEELRASVRRLRDLMEHARTADQMSGIERQAEAAGFSLIERIPLYHAGTNLVGWQLIMHRS